MDFDKNEIKSEYLGRLLSELSEEKPKNETKPDFNKILPEPCFCIKLHDSNQKKIFINICAHEKIPKPKEFTENDLIKLLDSADSFPNFRIPMSIGDVHIEKDNAGNECSCFDVVINPNFLLQINNSLSIKSFFLNICFEGIENKHNITLSREWRALQNKKAHGEILEQYLRTTSKPIIIDCEELDKPNEKRQLITEIYDAKKVLSNDNYGQKPFFEIVQIPVKGSPEFFVVEIKLPNIKTSRSIDLKIGENRVVLTSRSKIYYLDFYLPEFVEPEKSAAEFNMANKILTLTMPVKL